MTKFDMQVWVDKRVMPTVQPLILGCAGLNAEKWRVALQSACLKDPKLMDAIARNPNSALLAITKCAQLGLSPDPALQHFALVPFKGIIEGIPMWRGWLQLAMDSGRVVDGSVQAEVIYRQEEEARDQSQPLVDPRTRRVMHTPNFFERDNWSDKDIIGAYAEAQIIDGPFVSHVMGRKSIDKRLAMGSGHAARNWYPEMCKAKVLGGMMRSGKVPLTPKQQRTIGELEDVRPVEATFTDTPAPALAAPIAPKAKPTGSQVMFDQLEEDPLPSDDRQLANLTAAVSAEFDRQSIDEERQSEMIGDVSGDPAARLDQLLQEELKALLAWLTDGDAKTS